MAENLQFWSSVTHMGGVGVLLLAAGALAAWLYAGISARAALGWGALFCGGMAVVVATKIAFIGWGLGSAQWDFTGLSGHAMRAACVLPVLFYFVASGHAPGWRVAGFGFGAGLAALVAVSRVVLQAHSVSEALGGYLFGLALALAMAGVALRAKWRADVRALLAVCVLLIVPAPHALGTTEAQVTQRWITTVALALSDHEKPFERGDWRVARQPVQLREP